MPFRIKHNSILSEELLQEISHYIETYFVDVTEAEAESKSTQMPEVKRLGSFQTKLQTGKKSQLIEEKLPDNINLINEALFTYGQPLLGA